LSAPAVHIVFFTGHSWDALDNAGRRYIRNRIAYARPPKAQVGKVTYDHWFGIHSDFDIDDMMAQAKKAAELGCEYFCLDAGWYGKGAFGSSGQGVWNEPDPVKFPGGVADVQRLSQFCRNHGMGFGLWSYWALKNAAEGEPRFKLETPEGVDAMVATMEDWIDTYKMTWFRFEMAGSGDLNYRIGYDQAMERITQAHPDFHIECCLGGGQRFDLGMIRWCTSTWISDHTANADVCRNMQSGALRFWPSHFLNSAIRVHRNTGDKEATVYNFISRMIGAPSFNGDIAHWSDEATARMRRCVDVYKSIRHLQDDEPVSFPLPQVRTLEDWDVIVFGDGTGEGQLMYIFNMLGPRTKTFDVPGGEKPWQLVLESDQADASVRRTGDHWTVHLDLRSAAVFRR
jgi:alpha-galactosidase